MTRTAYRSPANHLAPGLWQWRPCAMAICGTIGFALASAAVTIIGQW
jgi:hypothetical protein